MVYAQIQHRACDMLSNVASLDRETDLLRSIRSCMEIPFAMFDAQVWKANSVRSLMDVAGQLDLAHTALLLRCSYVPVTEAAALGVLTNRY